MRTRVLGWSAAATPSAGCSATAPSTRRSSSAARQRPVRTGCSASPPASCHTAGCRAPRPRSCAPRAAALAASSRLPTILQPVRAGSLADKLLRRALERLRGSRPALVPEYPLALRSRWGWGSPVLGAVAELLAAEADSYRPMVDDVCELLDWAREIPRSSFRPGQPAWENDFWG